MLKDLERMDLEWECGSRVRRAHERTGTVTRQAMTRL